MTKEEIDLSEATYIAREFLRMMFGNLYLHSFSLEYAGSVNQDLDDNYVVRCRLTVPFNRGKIHYSFIITKKGVIKKMELIKNG